jgi:beta-glucosidase-like glycosyl hydrolase
LKKVAGYWNYDSSEFAAVGPVLTDDDAMEAIWKKQYSLSAFTAADQFKSYEDLKKRMDYVLGNKNIRNSTQEETEYDNYAATEQKTVSEEDVMRKLESSYQQSKAAAKDSTPSPSVDEDDDPMSYFAKLADS